MKTLHADGSPYDWDSLLTEFRGRLKVVEAFAELVERQAVERFPEFSFFPHQVAGAIRNLSDDFDLMEAAMFNVLEGEEKSEPQARCGGVR